MLQELKSLIGWSEKTTAKIDALVASQSEASALREQVATITNRATTAEEQVANLAKELGDLKSAHATEISTLKASIETERKRATEVLAAQGLPADAIPGTDVKDAGAPGKPNARAKYQQLLATDPRAAGEFYAANVKDIFASK